MKIVYSKYYKRVFIRDKYGRTVFLNPIKGWILLIPVIGCIYGILLLLDGASLQHITWVALSTLKA